jgi:hypothetical protein
MNRIYFYMVLILLPVFLHAEANQLMVSGKWYNPYINRQIEIIVYPDGLKVRGIHSKNRWTYFERSGNRTFRDWYGNRIRFQGLEELLYTSNTRRARLTFFLMHGYQKSRWDKETGGYADRDYYDERDSRYGNDDTDVNEKKYQNRNQKVDFDIKDMEGTWKVNDLSKNVFIIETRDGIKARFSDENKWFSYIKEPNDSAGFVSEEGHQYIYSEDGKLIWVDKTNAKKFFLNKISDDFLD